MSFFEWQGDDLLLKLHVQPRAKENSINGIHGDMLKLKIKTPPIDNKANKDITTYLANEFNVTKTNVTLLSGQQHRDKKFLIKSPKELPGWFKELSADN